MVDTSFLNLFFKLTQFAKISYECKSGENLHSFSNYISGRQDCLDTRNYFVNQTNARPPCTCLAHNNALTCDAVEGGLWSSDNVTINERAYKDILISNNGLRFSMTDDDPQCFEAVENYSWFVMYVE